MICRSLRKTPDITQAVYLPLNLRCGSAANFATGRFFLGKTLSLRRIPQCNILLSEAAGRRFPTAFYPMRSQAGAGDVKKVPQIREVGGVADTGGLAGVIKWALPIIDALLN